jgi:3-carboxy-cis,cis-muconate cycloisomerase
MALAEPLGRHEAHALVEAAVRRATDERRSLGDTLGDDPAVTRHLDRAEIARRLSPDRYLGVADVFVERVLARRASQDHS